MTLTNESPEQMYQRIVEAWEKDRHEPHVDLPVSDEIRKLCERGNITFEEMCELRGNSREHVLIHRALDPQAFLMVYAYCAYNSFAPWNEMTYNEAMAGHLAREVHRRLKGCIALLEEWERLGLSSRCVSELRSTLGSLQSSKP
jgi:hypothetical protein